MCKKWLNDDYYTIQLLVKAILYLQSQKKVCPYFLYSFIWFVYNLVQKVPTNIHWVTVSFSEFYTVKFILDQWVYTNCCTHTPHLLSYLDDILFKRCAQMLFRSESFFKISVWDGVIFLQAKIKLYLHIPQENKTFKVKNATTHSAIFVTLILKIIGKYGNSVHRL